MIYLELFWTFLKIGAFTFGGGYAMLPLIQNEVISHGWLTEAQIVDFIAVCESTPGPIAVNMATYVGQSQGGILGAVCATLGVVLPSFLVILVVAHCFEKFKNSKIVKGCMSGLKPAVIGLIAGAVLSVGKTVFAPSGLVVLTDAMLYVSLGIFLLSLFLAFKKLSPIIIIVISAALGIAAGFLLN